MKIKDVLKQKVLLMDGAFGTYFKSRYYDDAESDSPELDVRNHPERVRQIHREYIDAGADIIRTNTFGINHSICETAEEKELLIQRAVCVAREAIAESGRDVWLAGSVGPIKYSTDKEEKKAFDEYKSILDMLLAQGVELFVFETFSDIDMVQKIAAYVKEKAPQTEVIAQFVFNKMGYTKYGYNMQRVVDTLAENESIDVFGVNCGIGAAHMSELFEKVRFHKDCYVSVLPNAGYQQELMGREMYLKNTSYYISYMKKMLQKGANIIGGCCGTNPFYIREMRKLIDKQPLPVKKLIENPTQEEEIRIVPNAFMEKLKRKEKVFVVEIDSPFGKSADKFMESAFRLKENAVDMVTVSDSPMAKARAEAFEMAIYVRNKTGLTMMPHLTCRDRNAIALHATFLGAHINGIRNILIITGDPVGREDRDEVTPVFDFNSVKLMQYLKNMNEEVFREEPVYYGGALNYAGANVEAIVKKMKRKMNAGCSYFLTQPVYSDEDIERMKLLKERTGASILCGLMPLVSLKNAKFMQNEMPGIHVPDEIVKRYRAEMTRQEAEQTAADICVEIGRKMQDFADGYYIMTPFNRVQLVNRIIQELRGSQNSEVES